MVRSLLVTAAVCATTVAGAVPAGAAARPALMVEAARSDVTLYRYSDGQYSFIYGDLGMYAVADLRQAFEVRAKRKNYDTPIVARLVRKGRDRVLPTPPDFSGLPGFFRTTFRDPKGNVVSSSVTSFCPNAGEPVRRSPTAPASSPYPRGCEGNPYSLGAVWGLQAGYATRLHSGYGGDEREEAAVGDLPDLPAGSYLATTSITPAYRAALRISEREAQATVRVTVVQRHDDGCDEPGECLERARAQTSARRALAATTTTPPVKLSGARTKPSGPLPDLRSLPAWGIRMDQGHYLAFGATVWNAGRGRLVVDGFRSRKTDDLMEAYQYFFSASGKQKGYAPVGGMEWDGREGHEHWHFKDFAHYRLVAADQKTPVLDSGKEAFCLANTDAVDYTVKGATWRPASTDLHTSCGSRESLGVREVLDTGSGDTYAQYLPGQSFDLDGIKNGTYYIEVTANPDKKLYERRTGNNTSLRQVVLGGSGHHRTVAVAKVGMVVEPPLGDGEGARRR